MAYFSGYHVNTQAVFVEGSGRGIQPFSG